MKISALREGEEFTTKNGKTKYRYVGELKDCNGKQYYLSARANSKQTSGFYTVKNIDVKAVDDLPF